LLYILVRLGQRSRTEEPFMSQPTMIYFLLVLFCLFRILATAIDPMNLFTRLYYWGYLLLFWLGYCFGYAAFVLICTGWIHVAATVHPRRWQRIMAKKLYWFTTFTVVYMFVVAIAIITANVNLSVASRTVSVSETFASSSCLDYLMHVSFL